MRAAAPHVVIVGGGQAASELATHLRMNKHAGAVTIVSAERQPPYQRPPLSKAFLSNDASPADLLCRPTATYEGADIELVLGATVRAIDRAAHQISLVDGRSLAYDRLVLATGGRARRLPQPPQLYASANVHELRTLADATGLRASLAPNRRLTIIGGGYIGLEVAALAVQAGAIVTVLEALPRVLARVTAPVVSAFFESAHRAMGVDIRTGTEVAGFDFGPDGAVVTVNCANGDAVGTDAVLIGIGMIPNAELAADAGLLVADGIVVNETFQTEDPDVFAIGDCANFWSMHAGRRVRLESVPNALEQARSVAAVLTGRDRPYDTAPWFWSDQYDLRLRTVGLQQGYETTVVRGDPASRSFLVGYLRNGRLIAADAISRPREFAQIRRLVNSAEEVDAEMIADERVSLSQRPQTAAR